MEANENGMAVNALETEAHELLDHLGPSELAAVVQLLEAMVYDKDEPVTGEDRRRLHEGQSWFAQRGGKGIPMEDALAGFGLKPDDFPPSK